MRPLTRVLALSAAAVLAVSGCGGGDGEVGSDLGPDDVGGERNEVADEPVTIEATPEQDGTGTATVVDAAGDELGTVTFTEVDGGVEVNAEIEGLTQGFYAFHVHGIGLCEPESAAPDDPTNVGPFLSAGGHLGADTGEHGTTHDGDLPSLYVTAAGMASLTFVTDAFTTEMLLDDDGSAVMIHDGRDNFANIPERYAPDGPDEDTLKTGDAGSRIGCGVIE